MNTNNFISSDANIINTKIGNTGVKVFKNATIKNSRLDDYSIIGDDAIIIDSHINSNASINRGSNILRSVIGKFTYTTERIRILNAVVGNFCGISWQSSIGAGKHHLDHVAMQPLWRFHMFDTGNLDHDKNKELKKRYKKMTKCIVGNDVWIAPNVVIMTDLKIGNGAVIGAGAIVTKNVEPFSIVAGVPAKVLRKRFDEKIIDALEKIQWWNWPTQIIRENLDLIYSTKVNGDVIERLSDIGQTLERQISI